MSGRRPMDLRQKPPPRRPAPLPGEPIPVINQLVNQRYEVVEKIGDSPLFAVYRARDKTQNRVVAIKSVLAPYADLQEFLEGLKSGLVASGSLKHPNIAQFFELGMED